MNGFLTYFNTSIFSFDLSVRLFVAPFTITGRDGNFRQPSKITGPGNQEEAKKRLTLVSMRWRMLRVSAR